MSNQTTPEVTWAQRSSSSDADRNIVFLTLMVPDVPKDKCKIDLQSNKLTFTGESTSKKVTYHLDIELFAEVDPQESKISHTDANVAMVLRKKELKEEFWPRLLKDSKKQHYLKTDFDKWVDEDEQDEAGEGDEDYMKNMGGMPGGGMGGGMGGGDGGFGGIDFSKLGGGMGDMASMMGGAGGMPDMASMMGGAGGMGGMGGAGEDMDDDDEDDEDDEGMPALEGDEKEDASAGASKGKAKIEEVE